MRLTKFLPGAAALVASALFFSDVSNAQTLGCATGGPGGLHRTGGSTGGGGLYPTAFPPNEFESSLVVSTLPVGATHVTEIKLNGMTHTWASDVQVVLTAPNGSRFNVFTRGGADCDFFGDYVFVPPCTTGVPFPDATTCFGIIPGGTYDQVFDPLWGSGTQGVDDVPLDTIPAAVGTWKLTFYDWVATDFGSLQSWDICFGTPQVALPAVPNTTGPVNGSSLCASSVTLTWDAANCATSYDVDFNGVVTTGLTNTSFTASGLAAGNYNWRVRGVSGSGSSAYSATQTFTIAALATWGCTTGGGGLIPTSGGGGVEGVWPFTLPTGELTSTTSVVVPSGATRIAGVRLNGLSHTWSGDCQIVLTSPAGVNYNLFQQVDGIFGGGCGDDFSGDYVIVDATTGVDQCGIPGASFACGTSSPVASGAILQFYGAWTSGDAGIVNVDLNAIPIASGNWTLTVYDWFLAADAGSLGSWELCFDAGGGPSGPVTYCTSSTTTNGCAPAIAASAQPSATNATAPLLTVSSVEGAKQGLFFYGLDNTGFSPLTWGPGSSSFLCVKSPTQRTFAQASGGIANTCSGAFSQDWNAFQALLPGALGQPFAAGDKVYVQAWFRDPPAPKTTNLSNAVELTVQP